MTDWKRHVELRLPRLALPAPREAEILEELAELLEDTYNDARASGGSHQEAMARAEAQMPEGAALARRIEQAETPVAARMPAALHPEQIDDKLGSSKRGTFMSNFLHDVKYAARMLGKHPGFTALAVVALALGIGANTAIFSMAYALLEKPVSVPETKGLYAVEDTREGQPGIFRGVAPANLADWKEQSNSFAEWAISQWYDSNIAGEGTPERVQGFRVSANFFDVLNARPLHGRTFLPGEDAAGRERVTVLGYGVWQRRFEGDPKVIGKIVRLEGQPYEIVGVMPREFDYPVSAELWMPIALTERERQDRTNRFVDAIARLKPGVSRSQAEAELAVINERLEKAYPAENKGWRTRVMDIRERIAGNLTRQYMTLLMGAVGFVLLIACANVANLQLARATGRYREVAVRVALGASRWRVVRQLLTESILQSVMAVLLGMVFAYWSLHLVRSNFPPEVLKYVPGISIMGLDWPTFAYAFAIAGLAGVLAGLMPALHASRPNLNESLREGARGTSAGRGRHLTRSILVVAEVALALVLLVGAGLMVRGVNALRTQHDTRQPESLLTFHVNLPDAKYAQMPPRVQFFDQALERLKSVPGVETIGLGRSVPFNDSSSGGQFSIEARPAQSGETLQAQFQYVNDDWFKVLGIRLKEGRVFEYTDSLESQQVAVVSENLARQYWPNQSAIGQRIKFGNEKSERPWMTIVGVVEDVHYQWTQRAAGPVLYAPYRQAARQIMQFAVRTPGNPMALGEAVRKEIAAVDADMPIYDVKTHAQVISQSVTGITYVAVMLSVMGVIALVLASVGLYGVMAYSVTERTHEIGVRMALGAQLDDVLRLVLGRGILLTGIGLAIGLILAVALAKLISGLVVGVDSIDLATFGGVVALLIVVSMAATFIPARRATQVDPLVALRYE